MSLASGNRRGIAFALNSLQKDLYLVHDNCQYVCVFVMG
jgi:hypothetical protein